MEQTRPVTDLLASLRQAEVGFDAEALADAVWLSQFFPTPVVRGPAREQELGEEQPPNSQKGNGGSGNQSGALKPATGPPPVEAKKTAPDGSLYTGTGTGGRRATAIQVPAASPLPNSLELSRAFRPFGRRRPSANRFELDEEATAESIAQYGFLRPALRPIAERWFDVALIVDGARSMDPWTRTIDELHALLARHGAFGQVRRWRLLAGNAIELENFGGARTSAQALSDPRRRTLLLILTDGVSAYWNSDPMARTLAKWAAWAPMAFVQVFSPRQWPHTALGAADRKVRSRLPGAANRMLEMEFNFWESPLEADQYVAVPVISLAAESVLAWADAAMASGTDRTPAVMFMPGTAREAQAEEPPAQVDARELVDEFQALATPQAFQLICYLAAVSLTLPVMRIVQQEFIANPRVEDLAQVIASGLIERVSKEERVEPDLVIYNFRSDVDVREMLLGGLRLGTALQVRRKVEAQLKAFIEKQLGKAIENFRAFVLDESGDYELPESAQALIQIERGLLARIGIATGGVKYPKLVGSAKVRQRCVLDFQEPQRVPALALRQSLLDAGHEVVLGPVSSVDFVLTFDGDMILDVFGWGLSDRIDFSDPRHWQSAFDQLLSKLDSVPRAGDLWGVPPLPEFYWQRPEFEEAVKSVGSGRGALLVRGEGCSTFGAAIAHDIRVRRMFTGGIYWEPRSYPTAGEPMLLIDPAPHLHQQLRPQDQILIFFVIWERTVRIMNLPPLTPAQQTQFLGDDGFPSDLQGISALGGITLLARWKRILRAFGQQRVEDWIRKTAPHGYGSGSPVFAEACLIGLLPEADRSALTALVFQSGHHVEASDQLYQTATVFQGGPRVEVSDQLYQTATNWNLLNPDRTLRAEVREALLVYELSSSLGRSRVPEVPRDPEYLAVIAQGEGYAKLLERCYPGSDPQFGDDEVYRLLLTSIKAEDEDWTTWLSKILGTTSIASPQPSWPQDSRWHWAMWQAAGWLNSGTEAEPISDPEVAKLMAQNYGNTLTSRVASYIAFLSQPSIERANRILSLLLVGGEEFRSGRALHSWLRAVSWIAPRISDDADIQLTNRKIDAVQSIWHTSSLQYSSVAEECQSLIRRQIQPWLALARLANEIAGKQDDEMEPRRVVRAMQKVECHFEPADYQRMLKETQMGRRLIPYSRLLEQPDGTLLQPVFDAFEKEDSKFGQYRALLALESILRSGRALSERKRRILTEREAQLDESSHRKAVILRILAIDRHARSFDRPNRFIWVVGTGYRQLTDQEWQVAEILGTELARGAFGLLSGGWPGVDHVTAAAFTNERRSQNLPIESALTQVLKPGANPDFSEGKREFIENYRDQLLYQAENCMALILIGGRGSTLEAYRTAVELGKPVFPIGGTGGDAEIAFKDMSKRGLINDEDQLGVPLSSKEDSQGLVLRIMDRLTLLEIPGSSSQIS